VSLLEKLQERVSKVARDHAKLSEELERALELYRSELNKPYRCNGGIELPGEAVFLVIGDIHGDYDTLLEFLQRGKAEEVLEEGYIVFLGDYIDRGPKQVESILLPLLLKLEEPERVVMLRGNHEPPEDLVPYPHDFPDVLFSRYGSKGIKLYKAFMSLFELLPYVAVARGSILFLHGGPPTMFPEKEDWKVYFSLDSKEPIPQVLEEVLWNDPDDYVEEWEFSPRGAGRLFGAKITERALKITGTRVIVRGHEPADEGYKFNHRRKVLTLFSRLGPPYMNKRAAVLRVDTSEERWAENLDKYIVKIGQD